MKKVSILPVFLLFSSFFFDTAYCGTRYFIGYSRLKPVRLKLITDSNTASIQYYGQKDRLKLVFFKEEELRRGDHPSLIQYEWEEIYNNEKTGRYVMVSQGAVIYHFIYINYRTTNISVFDEDLEQDNNPW
jgi:hypothetical protein